MYARARILSRCQHDAEDFMHPAYVGALANWVSVLHGLMFAQRVSWMLTTITRMAARKWRRDETFDDITPKLYAPDWSRAPDPEAAALAGLPAEICLDVIRAMPDLDKSICIRCWATDIEPSRSARCWLSRTARFVERSNEHETACWC